MIIENYLEYGCFDYESELSEVNGFKLGEVVIDQELHVGIILQIFSDGDVRCNSNGVCSSDHLKKCSDVLAEQEIVHFKKIRSLN